METNTSRYVVPKNNFCVRETNASLKFKFIINEIYARVHLLKWIYI